MASDSKRAVLPRTIAAHLVLAELRQEAHQERHIVDDDLPNTPEVSPLDSAQAKRAQREVMA